MADTGADCLHKLLHQGLDADNSVAHIAASISRGRGLLGEFLADAFRAATTAPDAYGVTVGREGAPDLSPLALPATAGALADLPAPGLGIGAVRRASGMGWGHDIGAVLALWLPDSAEGGVGGKHVHGRPQLVFQQVCVV